MEKQSALPARYRKGGSFVWKITLRQTWRTLWLFLWVNLLLVALALGGLWYGVEMVAADLIPQASTTGVGRRSASVTDRFFAVDIVEGQPEGVLFNDTAVRRLSLLPGSRRLEGSAIPRDWWNTPADLRYYIYTPLSDTHMALVAFTPGILWTAFLRGMAVLLAFEALCVLSGLFKISRSVRKTLRPISQLTLAAHQGTAPAQQTPQKAPELQFGSTIDTLNAINENRLDMRIDVENEREELRGLAMAINSMLDRVDFAYRSQLRFVSDASHELRTPISVIQGYANLLDRWGKEDEKTLEESIAAIKQEAESMKELVEQLLFLARSDNNSITLRMEMVDLTALVQEVARESEMIDSAHAIVCPERPPLFVSGDVQLLKQALRILVDNALKYTPRDGKVTLDAKEQEGMAALTVTDSGVGIGADDLPKLFDRFYRADASRTRQTGGAGLGLSIAKWIVDSHGGTMEIISREGIGTRMIIKMAQAKIESVALIASTVPELRPEP